MISNLSLHDLYYRTIVYDANKDKVIYNYFKFNLDSLNGKDANLFQKLDNGEYAFIMVFRWSDYVAGKYDKKSNGTVDLSTNINDDLKTNVPGTNTVNTIAVPSQIPTININNISTKDEDNSDDFNDKIEKLLEKIQSIKEDKSDEKLADLIAKKTQPSQSINADNVTNVTVNVNVNDLMQLKKDAKAEYVENKDKKVAITNDTKVETSQKEDEAKESTENPAP